MFQSTPLSGLRAGQSISYYGWYVLNTKQSSRTSTFTVLFDTAGIEPPTNGSFLVCSGLFSVFTVISTTSLIFLHHLSDSCHNLTSLLVMLWHLLAAVVCSLWLVHSLILQLTWSSQPTLMSKSGRELPVLQTNYKSNSAKIKISCFLIYHTGTRNPIYAWIMCWDYCS